MTPSDRRTSSAVLTSTSILNGNTWSSNTLTSGGTTTTYYTTLDHSTLSSSGVAVHNSTTVISTPMSNSGSVSHTTTKNVVHGTDTETQASSAASTTTPPAASGAVDQCNAHYSFFLDSFEIYGRNFDEEKVGEDGSGLKKQIKGCGALTAWYFQRLQPYDSEAWQWHATGQLPIGTKACVGRAVVSAGGTSPDGCTGSG